MDNFNGEVKPVTSREVTIAQSTRGERVAEVRDRELKIEGLEQTIAEMVAHHRVELDRLSNELSCAEREAETWHKAFELLVNGMSERH